MWNLFVVKYFCPLESPMNNKHYFLFIVKNISCVQFLSCYTSDENFLMPNFSQTMVSTYACINVLVSINRLHTCLLSCCKSKCLTCKVITGRYVIALRSGFGQTIEVGYSPSLLLLWTLDIVHIVIFIGCGRYVLTPWSLCIAMATFDIYSYTQTHKWNTNSKILNISIWVFKFWFISKQ